MPIRDPFLWTFGRNLRMRGYTKLAAFMTEKHYTMVRKYDHLAVRDLLYLQAEICHLESEYESIAKRDALEQDERQYYDRVWFHLRHSESRGFGGEQWEVAMEIRAKLREYYSSVLQYKQVASLPHPTELERKMLSTWIGSPSFGCRFLGRDLGGFAQPSMYEERYQRDLIMLDASHGEDDIFTKLLLGPVLTTFHWFWRHRKAPLPMDLENPSTGNNLSGLHHYSDDHVQGAVSVIGTVASSLTPMISIIALFFASSLGARLGLVCGFTVLFSFSLALATKARRIEIFAATAAFASVQVVFVGSTTAAI